MPRAQEIIDFVWEIAPNPDWGKENIFEFGDGNVAVEAVGVAWWITSEMIATFAGRGVTLGLTHERVIYDTRLDYHWGTPPSTWEVAANQRIADLCGEHGMAIHRFHSNLDLADWGMPRAVIDQLGWGDYPADFSKGVPLVVLPPMPLRDLIAQVKDRLRLPFVRYDGDPERVVSRVCVAWGGLCQWWNAAACTLPLGMDVILGGDVIDGVVRFARELDCTVIDAFHHSTEMEAMKRLAEKVACRFPELQVHYLENSMPWAIG